MSIADHNDGLAMARAKEHKEEVEGWMLKYAKESARVTAYIGTLAMWVKAGKITSQEAKDAMARAEVKAHHTGLKDFTMVALQ